MTPRQRLLCALDHHEPDRIPMDLGSTTFTGIHVRAYEQLRSRLGIPAVGEHVVPYSQVAVPGEAVLRRLAVDVRGVFPGVPDRFRESGSRWSDESGDLFRDEWGVVRRRPRGGHYYDLHSSPFGHLDLPEPRLLDGFAWPDAEDPGRYRGLRQRVKQLREDVEFAVVGHLGADVFLRASYLRGFEQFLTDLLINRDFAVALCERITDFWERMARRFLDEIGDEIDVITILDDIADQSGPIMSPALYREIIKPMHARLIHTIRARTQARVLFHCCGSVVDFMPDFVEIGVDAITPVQVSARGMDMSRLKKEYGDRISFWGGIDSLRVLPHGTASDVREEVRLRLGQMARRGGYVLCAVHNIQPDVPPENVMSLYEAGRELGRYPLGQGVAGCWAGRSPLEVP